MHCSASVYVIAFLFFLSYFLMTEMTVEAV